MIDLSFLTEAEQEAILKVLNRDAELKKAEDERVKHLQDVVNDENEFKYKSGQWFYEAKSKRHREKIHGVDLVRASIRKRKKPATIAELGELNKESSKRRWVNSVNQDLFIPPELFGVMEAPDEAEEDVMVKKQEGNQSSRKVGITSPEKDHDKLRNGTFSPPKARQNPFNSEGLQDETEYRKEAPSLKPENVQMNGTEKSKSDIMSSLTKYGVKLPYPELSKNTLDTPKAQDGKNSQKEDVPIPVPKPRTFKVNGQPQDHSNSTPKRDDSFNGTGKPRGILKRRSSSSSTDSESIRISQGVEPNKIVLPVSPILEAGQNHFFDEQDLASDGTPDRLKQVRFSEKVQQRPPSPIPEPFSVREVGEYGILDPGLSVNNLDNGLEDHSDSEDYTLDRDSSATEILTKILEQNAMLENQASIIEQPPSLENERNRVAPKEDLSKNDTLRLEASTDLSIEPPSNISSDEEPLYAVVKKTPAASSPSEAQDFDLDDALMEPRFHGQRGKTQNIYLNEKPLEFGKSFSGGGKMTLESSYPSTKHKESYSLSSEELTPERARIAKTPPSIMGNKPVTITQDGDDPVESVALWRRPFMLENEEPRQPSPELTKEQKNDVKARDSFGKTYSENSPTSKSSKETEYKSSVLQNRYDAEHKPLGLTANLVQNVSAPSKTSGQLDSLLHENKGRKDLPKSAHFKVMSLKERMNEMPREQMSNPSQFQSLKHFWNVEEKNLPGETVTSPDKILMHVSSRNKPSRSDIRQRSSEIPADEVILPNTLDNLSEEEQTSQKVASWLAQTPTVYVDGQMDQNEDQLSSGKEIVEHVQKSAIPKKSDDEFTNALQKLREEALEAPKITEKSKTEEIQLESQGEPDLVYHKKTTITFSPISQNYTERRAPTTDLKMTDKGFYERVIQGSNQESPAKTLSVAPKNEPYDEKMHKNMTPEKSPRESRIGFETLNNGISDEEVQKEESSLPKEESEAEEIIAKSAVPRSRDQQDFSVALKKLEIEASKQPPLPDFEVKDQSEIPKEEITQNMVTPVKSSIKIGFEHFGSANDTNEFETPTVQTEEIIEKSAVPKSRDQQDFILGLKKLELEASKKPPLPDFEVEYRDGLLNEEITQNTVTPVKSSLNLERSSSANDANEFETPTDHSVTFQPKVSYASIKESAIEVPSDLEETIKKITVPSKKENEDLSIALRKLELEAIEHQSDKEYVAGINQEVEFEKPESQLALQTTSEDHSDINSPHISKDGKSVDDLKQSPKVSSYGLKWISPTSQLDLIDGQGKLLVSEEQPIEKTRVESQESSVDFHNRLTRLEEQAKVPEDPEGLLVDDTVKVSQFPNREVVISKKVYSSIESMPLIENSSDSGKPKEVDSSWNSPKDINDPKSKNYSPYEELANYPHSPEPSGSYTGNGNLLYKKPEVGSPEVSNSKSGKPALSESPSDTSSSKNDKYEFMVMKAQDESISKVLDWFSRSCDIGDNPTKPVGVLQPSKGTSSQILFQKDGNKKESGPNESNFKTVSEPTSYLESPNNAGKPELRLSNLGTQSGDNNLDITNRKLPATVSLVEENGVSSGLIQFSSENESNLQYGNSGGGSGKILNKANAMQDNGQCPEAKYLDIFEVGKAGLGSEEPKVTLKQNLIPVATEFMSNQEMPEMVGKPHSRLSLSSTDANNDQSDIKNDELLTQANSIENSSQPRVMNSNLEAGNCLEFGKSVSGSGKRFSPSQEVSEVKEPRLSLSRTDTNDDQSDVKDGELLTQADSIENASPSEVMNSNLEAGNCLEFGKSGGGSGKTSSPSQEISKVKKPRISLTSTDTDDDQSGTKNDELLTQISKENISPSRLHNLYPETENCLEYGMSGGGPGKPVSLNQEIPEVGKPKISVSSTGSTDHDQSETGNVDLLTPVHVMEEASVPPAKMNPVENPLDLGKSEGGSGKMSNQAADYTQTDPPLKEVKKEVLDKGEEELKGEKESDLSKEEPKIQSVVEAETLNMATEKGQLDGSRPENVESINIEVSPSHDTVKFNVHQRRVSDIKQLWEGDKSALPAAKKTFLNGSKQMPSPNEISIIHPQRSSIESDDRSSPSLVTFKRVMVEEEEENSLLPVDQLKSFWENEKNKDGVNAKQPDGSSVKNGLLDADEVSALAEPRSKFKKRHTFHSFFEKEQNPSTGKNPPGRSVSLSDNMNDNLKDRKKSTTFQNLRSFWNVDHKANPNDGSLSDTKSRQFRSNPDLSKESFVAKIKSKLESQSLEDIREDTPDTYQVQPVKEMYNHKNKTPLLSTFTKQKSSDNSLRNSVESQENVSIFQDCNPIEFTSVSDTQTKSKSPFEVSGNKKEVSEVEVKPAQKPEKVSEFSLRLQKLRDEFSDKSLEGTTSGNCEYNPKTDEMAKRDEENQNMTVNENREGMPPKECERRQFLVKQIGVDAENTSVGAEAFHFLENCNGRDNLKNNMAQVDNGEQVYETVERTLIPPPKHSEAFDRGLQKLYNESLEVSPVSEVKLSQNAFVNIQSPEENFSKVLTVSSSKMKSNVQRASSKERSSSFQQPIVINLSSTKINVGNEATGKHSINLDEETEHSIAKESDITPAEKQECKKEILERIEMPEVVPRAPFNYFDEGLKKLYDESRDLTATKSVSDSLQALPAKQDLVIHENVTSVSQAQDILEQEIGETIGKASAPTKIYHAKSSEKDQKEDVNDEEEPFIENVPSNHVTLEESQPRFSEHIVAEGTVSEMSPKGKEASLEENVQSLKYETIQESPFKTDSPFTDMQQSSPMKEKSNSLRKSTLELYLEIPYRREMSKSMDFELGEYVASDVDKERYQLNSSTPTEDIPVNSFPQNAETLKRLSQSVPAFIHDDTDGRDTDSASESSFQIGRHKKSPSSLTNLSGSSGMASMSSVSGSVMSIYSGDFGNVDIKGGIEFSIDYVEQLKEFLIYIYQCRELAVAEVKKQRSDPYVKAYLLPEKAKMGKRKTAVKKKTLNPVYNEILRYKIPKQSLLAQTLNLSVWHHDALGRNSFLGEVNLNLGAWDWSNTQRKWYQLEPRTPAAGIGLENRGEMKLSLKYVPMSPTGPVTKPNLTGEVYIWIRECLQLPMLRDNKINSFVKCTVLPDTSRKSRQKTRTVDKTPNPIFNHTMVYDGFKEEDLREACVELTVWDHNRLSNHFLGGIRIGLGTGKSYGTPVDWMDSTHEETTMWEKMMASPNTWVDGMLPLRMFKMAKLAK